MGIVMLSFLPYLHDFDLFKEMKGFSGFSSLRVGLWAVALYVLALSGWVLAFLNSRGKRYRFVILAPIFMLAFQLAIYVLDARSSTSNEFTNKVLLNFVLCMVLVGVYFYQLRKKRNEE